jgi:hypothetical protein
LVPLLLLPAALAYETDQLTDRGEPLEDVLDPANARMDVLLGEAVVRANLDTRCQGTDAQMRVALGRRIFQQTSRDTYVSGRDGLEGFGYGAYSAWLETAPIDKRTFTDRHDIYGEVAPGEGFILSAAGVCSTIRLGGVLLGTDKLDHFLGEGYAYAEVSHWGEYPERALRWGTRTELTIFGMMTSSAFSFADLRANWDGYRFYSGLLGPDSEFRRTEEGCVTQSRPFDWTEWINTEYDEVLNPPVYVTRVAREVTARLAERRDAYCRGYEEWGVGLASRVLAELAGDPGYVWYGAPERTDPFQLDALCASHRPAAPEPGTIPGGGPTVGLE